MKGIAVIALIQLMAATATAEPNGVVVLDPEVTGEASPALGELVVRSCEAGAKRGKRSVVSHTHYSSIINERPSLRSCMSDDCLLKLHDSMKDKPGVFVTASVEAVGSSYTIKVSVRVVTAGKVATVKVEDAQCNVCTTSQLADTIKQTTDAALKAIGNQMARVKISSEPLGATITAKGDVLGETPVYTMLRPGRHVLEARLRGYESAKQTIDVRNSSAQQAFQIKLARVGDVGDTEPRFGAWKWVAVGTAAASIGTGVALLAIDGNQTCSSSVQTCPRVYNTKGTGIGLVAAGVAVGGLATYMFLADSPKAPEYAVGVSRDGVFVSRHIRF